MRFGLIAIVLAVSFTSASAYPDSAGAANSANAVAHAALQQVSSNIDVSVAKSVKQLPGNSAGDASSEDDSDWRSYGTLLATLVLMAAIAVRRQKF